jgi:hypothetical protein
MKSLYTLGVAAGLAALAVGFSAPASAAPAAPIAIKQAVGEAPSNVIDVRRGGPHWRGGRHFGGRHWGGRRWGHHGGWGHYRHGWRRHHHRRWYGGGWAWGLPFAVAPYYYNDDCGYVTVRRWVHGRRVWVRRYQCW